MEFRKGKRPPPNSFSLTTKQGHITRNTKCQSCKTKIALTDKAISCVCCGNFQHFDCVSCEDRDAAGIMGNYCYMQMDNEDIRVFHVCSNYPDSYRQPRVNYRDVLRQPKTKKTARDNR